MIIEGRVTSGLGTAKMWVSKIDDILKQKTGMKVFHGTLNIKLEENYIVEPDFIITPEQYGGTENVLVKKCKIFEDEAYIVRAEKNQVGNGDHSLKIVEIVSNINLRKTYKLKDDTNIIILV